MIRQIVLLPFVIFSSVALFAQEDLLARLEEEQADKKTMVEATFKETRLVNGHSVETRQKNVLLFIIAHRFGTLNSGAYELFGLDNATIRIGLDYAPTDRLYVGVGRSSFEKTYDAFAKYRLLRQSKGPGSVPISLTWFSSISLETLRTPGLETEFADKLATTHQALIARKFNANLSLQLMPTWVHYNFVQAEDDYNDVLAIGAGGRYKLSKWIALNAEYYYQLQALSDRTYNVLAIGVDIETGGHVFQLHFTNATSMVPKGFIGETTNDFFDGDIHFGFNITRVFQLK